MSTLNIYTSQGEQVGDNAGPDSARIEDFFFDGVRLYLDTSGDPELTMFFRARESEAGRAEQYYAVYETETSTSLFERFERDLRQEVEEIQEMILETSSEDAQLVSLLTEDIAVPGTEEQHGAISSILAERKPLRLRVPTENAALGLVRQYVASPAERFAIGDDTETESMNDCDFVIEPGGDGGIEPLGDSVTLFEEQLRRTTANAARPRASQVDPGADETTENRLESLRDELLAVGVGVVLVMGVLVGLLNGAAVIGLELPGLEWLIVV